MNAKGVRSAGDRSNPSDLVKVGIGLRFKLGNRCNIKHKNAKHLEMPGLTGWAGRRYSRPCPCWKNLVLEALIC